MKKRVFSLLLVFAVLVILPGTATAQSIQMQDDFSGVSLDTVKWVEHNADAPNGNFSILDGMLTFQGTGVVNDWATFAVMTQDAYNRTDGSGHPLRVTWDVNTIGAAYTTGLTTGSNASLADMASGRRFMVHDTGGTLYPMACGNDGSLPWVPGIADKGGADVVYSLRITCYETEGAMFEYKANGSDTWEVINDVTTGDSSASYYFTFIACAPWIGDEHAQLDNVVIEYVGGSAEPTPTPTLTQIIVEEDFTTDPDNWTGENNRTAPSDFGFSNTNSNGEAGEAGGGIVRRLIFTWYGMELPVPLDSLDNGFTFEFDARKTSAITGANVGVGFINPATVTDTLGVQSQPNFIVLQADDAVHAHMILSQPPGNDPPSILEVKADDNAFGDDLKHHVKVQYVPTGQVPGATLAAGDFGQIVMFIDDGVARQGNLNEVQKTADWNITHFGIFATMNSDTTSPVDFFIDNVSIAYGSVEVNAAGNWTLLE